MEWLDLSLAPICFQGTVYLMFAQEVDERWLSEGGVAIDQVPVAEAGANGCALQLSRVDFSPGRDALQVERRILGGTVAILSGPAGSFTQTGQPRNGVVLDVATPALGAILPAIGTYDCVAGSFPAGVCGLVVQAVGPTSCCVSNSLTL